MEEQVNVAIGIAEMKPIRDWRDENGGEFQKWFGWSNIIYEKLDGFISRRILKTTKRK